jgi:hypothetical protein
MTVNDSLFQQRLPSHSCSMHCMFTYYAQCQSESFTSSSKSKLLCQNMVYYLLQIFQHTCSSSSCSTINYVLSLLQFGAEHHCERLWKYTTDSSMLRIIRLLCKNCEEHHISLSFNLLICLSICSSICQYDTNLVLTEWILVTVYIWECC